MDDGRFLDYLVRTSPLIDSRLHHYLNRVPKDSELYSYLYGILDEFIGRGGKRVRPAMAMLACEAVGGDPLKALSGGCAIEFFHVAALIHDDIMDASVLRRDQRCAHIIHGTPLAINAGDYALGLVCTIVVRDPQLDDVTKIAVLDVIGEMSERTVEGQALDVGWVRDEVYDLTRDDYLTMALGKTGYYSGIAPLKVGAIVGKASAEQHKSLEEFGKNASIAFQIQDDLLNILENEQTTGKDYLNDLVESKRTLMVIDCLQKARPADKERLVALLRLGPSKTSEDVAEIREMLFRYGSVGEARSQALNLILDARSYLEALPPSDARDILASMAAFFLNRER
jgi:geranylgeranyl diphosphate synthase type I